jgi:polyphenol oxidase
MFITPTVFKSFAITAAQSTRDGGYSIGPYASLNLGSNTDDNPSDLRKNKEKFVKALGFELDQVAKSKQVHGTEILDVTVPGSYEGYDAFITSESNILLAISTADCVPILLFDVANKVCAAIHAGWKGTKDKLSSKVIQRMKANYQSDPQNVLAYIGACIDECSFEVDQDVAKFFSNDVSRYDEIKRKYFINLKQKVKQDLIEEGLLEKNIEVSEYDTYTRTDLFYSHRKENGVTGRMWSVIGMKE